MYQNCFMMSRNIFYYTLGLLYGVPRNQWKSNKSEVNYLYGTCKTCIRTFCIMKMCFMGIHSSLCLPSNSVLLREVSFDEREDYKASIILAAK